MNDNFLNLDLEHLIDIRVKVDQISEDINHLTHSSFEQEFFYGYELRK